MNIFKKLGFRKSDEMETYIAYLAMRFEVVVLTGGLIMWSFYDFIKTETLGLPFLLFSTGVLVYFSALIYYKRKLGGTGEE